MRWEDERYVRVYVRDTAEWLALGWQAQTLLVLLLRKADRAGIVHTGKAGVRGLAALVGMPLDVVTVALPALLEDGCLRGMEGGYVFPNFLLAQEAKSSDAQRKREQRARDRDKALASGSSGSAAGLDIEAAMSRAAGQNSGGASRPAVTPGGHTTSRGVTDVTDLVTPSRAVPCLAVPSQQPSAAAEASAGGQASLVSVPATTPPPLPAKPKPPRKEADSEHHALWRALEAEYARVMGHPYASGNGDQDAKAVQWLRETAKATLEESVRRWGNLLRWSQSGFPTVTGFAALRQHWNAAKVTGATRPKSGTQGPTMSRHDWSKGLPPLSTREEEEAF
jgi:hypothetical protein